MNSNIKSEFRQDLKPKDEVPDSSDGNVLVKREENIKRWMDSNIKIKNEFQENPQQKMKPDVDMRNSVPSKSNGVQNSRMDVIAKLNESLEPCPELDYNKEVLKSLDFSGLIDTHCHLDFLFDRLRFQKGEKYSTFKAFKQDYIQEFSEKCFSGCIAVFCEPQKWGKFGYEDSLLSDHDVWCTFGVHPHHSDDFDTEVYLTLLELLKRERVVALGEIGLDYSQNNHVDHDIQKRTFLLQMNLALERDLAVCLHIRRAFEDGLWILDEAKVPQTYRIHLHCFNSDWDECQEWMRRYPNLKVGFTPMITFAKNKHLHEVVRKIPLSRILLETDSPYFLPRQEPISLTNGMSHPGMVIHTAAQIAHLKEVPIRDVIEANRRNVLEIYGIAIRPPHTH